MSDALNLNRLVYFAAVVDAGSFTRAAERLGVAKTIVSQQVARLEQELGTHLFARTTRRVQPTEAGRHLHARAVAILHEAEVAVAELSDSAGVPRGVLRIAAPNDFGAFVIAPLAADYCAGHPSVSVELVLGDSRIDLIGQEIDLAVQVGWLEDSSHQARRIGTFRQQPVAIPALAATLAAATPDQLAAGPFVANAALRDPTQWLFTAAGDPGRQCSVRLAPRLRVNTTPAALSATLAGGGFSILPDFLIDPELARGALVRLVPEWELPDGGVFIVYPAARFRPAKVTAFAALLSDHAKRHCGATAG